MWRFLVQPYPVTTALVQANRGRCAKSNFSIIELCRCRRTYTRQQFESLLQKFKTFFSLCKFHTLTKKTFATWLQRANVEFMPSNSGRSLPNHHTISCIRAVSQFSYCFVSSSAVSSFPSSRRHTHDPLCALNLVSESVAMPLSVHC